MKKKQRSRSATAAGGEPGLAGSGRRVAGIDLGSREHWVCVPAPVGKGPGEQAFGTTTPELERLADWLAAEDIESVAMESTHVYWIPLYELLESRGFEVLLVNARQLKNVPGRKTDLLDCQWLQRLHACGLLRGSFRPGDAITRLRALHRQMGNLVHERTRSVQWMQQALDQMNVQVHRAVSDLTGQTGMAIVRAIVAGERDPARLAALRGERCRKPEEQFVRYLTGNWRDEHVFNLEQALRLYDSLGEQIAAYEDRLEEEIRALTPPERVEQEVARHPKPAKEKAIRGRGEAPLRDDLCRFADADLTRIDGISVGTARTILTEVGLDLSAFPTERHFISWLRLAPRTAISGGKPLPRKKGGGTGSNRVAAALRMAAVALQRSQSELGASFRRIARRKGYTVAVFATARKLAQLVYRLLRWGQDYVDVGAEAYERRFRSQRIKGLQQAAESLGYEIVPQTPAAS